MTAISSADPIETRVRFEARNVECAFSSSLDHLIRQPTAEVLLSFSL